MNIIEKLYENKNEENLKIFLDLDGTITNWEKSFENLGQEITKGLTGQEYENKFGRGPMWEVIAKVGKLEFWEEMPWLSDGKQLWNYVKKYNPTILTKPAKSHLSVKGKEIWIERELGLKVPYIITKEKWKYANPESILIDDSIDKIIEWSDADGIGIHHKSADETIKELKRYGL